jgi:hypothetical protein
MRARRRRTLGSVLLAAVLAGLLIALLARGGGAARHPHLRVAARAAPATRRVPSTGADHAAAAHVRARVLSSAPDPGSLPQTHAFPSAHSATFRAEMNALWMGVTRDSPAAALAAFFPRSAYIRLKQIPSADSDWHHRLVHDYTLDLRAAHALLGRGAASARLVEVSVPSAYGHWVPPGACYNGIGYYEVPNARVVYRQDGAVRSFAIASMISWRGVWYVVHLGAVLRSGDAGTVDEPADGAGSSAYSSTC